MLAKNGGTVISAPGCNKCSNAQNNNLTPSVVNVPMHKILAQNDQMQRIFCAVIVKFFLVVLKLVAYSF